MRLINIFIVTSLFLTLCFSATAQPTDILIKAEFIAVENALSENNAGSAEKHLNKLIKLMATDSIELEKMSQQHGKNIVYFQLNRLKTDILNYRFENARQSYKDLGNSIQSGKLQITDALIRQGLVDQIGSDSALIRKATMKTDSVTGVASVDSAYMQKFISDRTGSLSEIDALLKTASNQTTPLKEYNSLQEVNSYDSALKILGMIRSAIDKEAEIIRKRNQQRAENEMRFTKPYLDYLMLTRYYVMAEEYIDQLIEKKGETYLQKLGLQETVMTVRNGAEKERKFLAYEKEKSAAWEKVMKEPALDSLKKYVDQYPDSKQSAQARLMIGAKFVQDQSWRYTYEDAKYLKYFLDLDTASIATDSIHALRMQKLSNATSFYSLLYLNLEGITFNKEDFLTDLTRKAKNLQSLNMSDGSFFNNKIIKPLIFPKLSTITINNYGLEGIGELHAPNLTYMDLSKNRLSKLPKLHEFTNRSLSHINLGTNQFKSVPGFVFECKDLKYLNVRQNKITSISRNLLKLNQLEYLDLSFNEISSLPAEIFALPNLKYLLLFGLPCTYLPPGIENLKNLEIVGVGGSIRQLPIGIEQLPELKGVYIADAPNIKAFPKIILECKKLEDLYIRGIAFDSTWEGISRLRRIKSLYLTKAGLMTIPEFIYRMPNLETLDLSDNLIVNIDDRIAELANLNEIQFEDCKLNDASLVRLRFAMPNTDITYYDKQLGKNVLSKKINDVSWLEFKKKYDYYLEGDVESAYELGRYFDDRGDAGIAYVFYQFGVSNKQLSGKAKGLVNNLSIAEMYDKIEELDKWTSSITIQNWRKLVNYYYLTVAYKEYYNVCTCTPRDEGGRKIKLNACNRLLNLHNTVLMQLSNLLPEYERQFNSAMSGNQAALSNAKTWLNVGNMVDNTGVLGSSTGWGTIVGGGLSAVSQSNAERLANEASNVTATVGDMANKMKEINLLKSEIEGIIAKNK